MKRNLLRLILPFVLILTTGQATAETTIAYTGAIASASINDPDGPTEKATGLLSGFNVNYMNRLTPSTRFLGTITHIGLSTGDQPVAQAIAQDAVITRFGASIQKGVAFTPKIRPWFGLGIVVDKAEYRNRYTIDTDSFIKVEYPDRSATELGLEFNASMVFFHSRKWKAGLHASHTTPISDGTSITTTGLMIEYILED